MTIEGTADKGTLREAAEGFVEAMDGELFWGRVGFYLGPNARTAVDHRPYDKVRAAYDRLRAALSSKDEPLDVERLARAWYDAVMEPEDGPWEHAPDSNIDNAKAWAIDLATRYAALSKETPA